MPRIDFDKFIFKSTVLMRNKGCPATHSKIPKNVICLRYVAFPSILSPKAQLNRLRKKERRETNYLSSLFSLPSPQNPNRTNSESS